MRGRQMQQTPRLQTKRQTWEEENHPIEWCKITNGQVLPTEIRTSASGNVPKTVGTHTPSTTTLNPWSCQAFPSFGGERGFTLASLHTFRLCPLAFATVCHCFKALFTTQHRHQPVVYPATRHSMLYASYRSIRRVVDIPVREVRKR